MSDRFSKEEFEELMETWDPAMLAITAERLRSNYAQGALKQFDEREEATLRALLKRLIPEDEGVDLAAFIDTNAGRPLGRGDRPPGAPAEPDLFRLGLLGLEQSSENKLGRPFTELNEDEQDGLITELASGAIQGPVWLTISAKHFFDSIYAKALLGYLAHPRVWMRIGFMGAAYPEGYSWFSAGAVAQRHARAAGWARL